jgi:hypothetical protein
VHAVVVRATIHNADRTREVLNSQVVPQASGAPGFKAGYWTWPTGEGELNVLAMIIFDSEENPRAAGDRVSARSSHRPDELVGLSPSPEPTHRWLSLARAAAVCPPPRGHS